VASSFARSNCDRFFLWGYQKEKVCAVPPGTVEDLMADFKQLWQQLMPAC
jgi:hypothetical protein